MGAKRKLLLVDDDEAVLEYLGIKLAGRAAISKQSPIEEIVARIRASLA